MMPGLTSADVMNDSATLEKMLLEACIFRKRWDTEIKLTSFSGASKLRQLESLISWEGK